MKRRGISVYFTVLLALMLAIGAAAYDFAPDSNAVVFVSDSGADTNSGASDGAAVKTLAHAYELLAKSKGGTIVVCGVVTVSETGGFAPANVGGAVLYTSVYGGTDYRTSGAKLSMAVNMSFANDTYFDNVEIAYTAGALVFAGNFNNLGFGAGVTCVKDSTQTLTAPLLVGGVNYPATIEAASSDKDYTITVAGGSWQGLMSGNRRGSAKNAIGVLSGDIAVRISGGTFDAGAGTQYVSATGANYHTGRTVMEIAGGEFNTALRIFRNLGYLPGDTTLDPGTGVHGQVITRISGGTFRGDIVIGSETQSVAYIDAQTAIIITGGEFYRVPKVYNQSSVSAAVICTTPTIQNILSLKCTTSIYFSNDTATPTADTMDVHFSGIVNTNPDPYVVCKDGVYYYCYSSNGVKVQASTDLLFGEPSKSAVQVFTPSQTSISNAKKEYWAPELHYFSADVVGEKDAGWYIYVAADNGSDVNHRMYVLRASEPENALSQYTMVGELELDGDKWAIDGTVMVLHNKLYFVWSGREENDLKYSQNIYIQAMTNPYTATGTKTLLAKPTELWETKAGSTVNEGPQILQHDGTTNIVYSVNGSWTQYYALASLTLVGDDPMQASSWYKCTEPLFQSYDRNSMYGTGHSSYVQNTVDGSWWIYYHANPSLSVPSGSSWWAERNTYLQEFTFADKVIGGKTYSMPVFGVPLKATEARTVTVHTPHKCDSEHFTLINDDGSSYCGVCGVSLQDTPVVTAGVTLKMTLGKTDYTVNGEKKAMDVAPIIRNARTMLPVRYVAEALGAEIAWDGNTSTATLKTADTEIKITVGAAEATVNGQAVKLDSPAFIESSRTYMPVRFVAEALGATVAWDGATSTATITK